MNLNNAEGKITISRPSLGGLSDDETKEYVEITLRDSSSGVEFVSARIVLADFARALTGLGHVAMRFDLRPDYVGMKYEHKTEIVAYSVSYAKHGDRDAIAAEAFAPFEIDGWKGCVDDLFNSHCRTRDGYRVTFTRYV